MCGGGSFGSFSFGKIGSLWFEVVNFFLAGNPEAALLPPGTRAKS